MEGGFQPGVPSTSIVQVREVFCHFFQEEMELFRAFTVDMLLHDTYEEPSSEAMAPQAHSSRVWVEHTALAGPMSNGRLKLYHHQLRMFVGTTTVTMHVQRNQPVSAYQTII